MIAVFQNGRDISLICFSSFKLLAELKEKVEKYTPLPGLKIPQARFLLVRQVGSGKSSFFNTINSIFRGYITSQACSGNAEQSRNCGKFKCLITKVLS